MLQPTPTYPPKKRKGKILPNPSPFRDCFLGEGGGAHKDTHAATNFLLGRKLDLGMRKYSAHFPFRVYVCSTLHALPPTKKENRMLALSVKIIKVNNMKGMMGGRWVGKEADNKIFFIRGRGGGGGVVSN